MDRVNSESAWERTTKGKPAVGDFAERQRTTRAEDLPGPGSVFLGIEWKFVKAVGVGEKLTARVEVTSVRDDKPICTLDTTISNEAGEPCVVGTATTYTVPTG